MVKIVEFTLFGWRAEIYTDSDGGSGNGDNPKVGYWYGSTREECEAIDPNQVDMYPMTYSGQIDPIDLALERAND